MDIESNDITKQLEGNPEYLAEAPAEEAVEAPVEAPEEVAPVEEEIPEAEEEETLESIISPETVEEQIEKADETVPLAAFLEMKKELKEMKSAQRDPAKDLSNSDVRALAEEYDVDEGFIAKLSATITKDALAKADEHYKPLLEKQERERTEIKKDEMFNKLFENAVKGKEHLANIANKDVIKALAFNPANSKKKVSELINEVYGKVAEPSSPDKKSLESYTPSTKKSEGIDFSNMTSDDHDMVEKDPNLAKKYGDFLVENINW